MTETNQDSAGAASRSTDFKSMGTVEELVSAYNEMVLTATDLGIKKVAAVETFVDVPTGVRACEHLHNLIEKTRNPKPKPKAKAKPRAEAKPKQQEAAPDSEAKSDKEDNTMPKKAKKTAARSKARKAVKGATRARIAGDAKIVWTGKDNPFKEGSGKHERVETVRKSSGQTKDTILKKKVATSGTIAYCVKNGLAKVG